MVDVNYYTCSINCLHVGAVVLTAPRQNFMHVPCSFLSSELAHNICGGANEGLEENPPIRKEDAHHPEDGGCE